MKMIEAMIRRSQVDDVVHALVARGINGMTLTDVREAGHEPTYPETYRGIEHSSPFLPRVKLEAVVDDADVDGTVDVVLMAAATGRPVDGRVLVTDVEVVVQIRTAQRSGGCLAPAAAR